MTHLKLEGRNSVEAALRLEQVVLSVEVLQEKTHLPDYKKLLQHCHSRKIPVAYSKKEQRIFQGIAATCKYPALRSFDDLKKDVSQKKRFVLLDHLEDPYNFAAIIRSSVALGYEGVIFAKNRAASITPGMVQASAGTLYHQSLYQVSNLAQSLDLFKKEGIWVYGTALANASPLAKTKFHLPYCLLIGNESKGLSPILQKKCDEMIKIEQEKIIDSLNASVAAGIMMYKAREKSTENINFK